MSYPASSVEPGVDFDSGTSLLLSGDSRTVRASLLDAIAEGLDAGETVILITADTSAKAVIQALRERNALAPDRLGIVDVTNEKGPEEVGGVPVAQLSSPNDLTGMSLEFAKHLERFQKNGRGERVRIGLLSVSTLLMYGELQTVFRFLHVFTSRIRSAGLFGLFALDPGMHEEKATNTIRAIFDAEASVSEDGVDLRGSGYLSA